MGLIQIGRPSSVRPSTKTRTRKTRVSAAMAAERNRRGRCHRSMGASDVASGYLCFPLLIAKLSVYDKRGFESVRMAELNETTGIPVPTIKYYIREGLVAPG